MPNRLLTRTIALLSDAVRLPRIPFAASNLSIFEQSQLSGENNASGAQRGELRNSAYLRACRNR